MKTKILLLLCFVFLISCNNTLGSDKLNLKTASEQNKGITKTSYYDKEGRLKKTFEYVTLCGEKYLNQGWYFNENGDTVSENSNFYQLKVEKETFRQNDSSKVTLFYKPLLKNSVSGLLISKDYDLKGDYCNLNEHPVDTLYFVDDKLEFYAGFQHKGEKKLVGYILEVTKELRKDRKYSERKVYLTIPFRVE